MGLFGKHQTSSTSIKTHRENLKKNLEHRLSVARSNGDEKLIQQLEQEAAYLNLK